jgi:hypothetical protein
MAAKKSRLEQLEEEHLPVEPDLAFWLHHVVHWHALLLAVIAVLVFGQVFFS